ncbi:arginase [Paenibacillus baekrokdamisoli]|uniref:Arginase n=1 Tax=Paenibacillus baekrokdamisoli TaxID=1712516 RepID=A0A3G9IPY3_9BACL|nr:arginase [Paenibacillus baekrokdamisoli]MBB3069726.1 arginase [Paenibacillus baekrokdamisoli]BBH20920.1 arginase [Paenibacillus baekrokdamisoli]
MPDQQPVTILPIPFDWGASRRGADKGPDAVLIAGLADRLVLLGRKFETRSTSYLPPLAADRRTLLRMKEWGRVHAMSEAVAKEIATIVTTGAFPLALGGDHSISIGTIAGLTQFKRRLGVIWIDAHADLNTPETSPSGNMHGMALAVSLGLGDSRFTGIGGGRSPKLQPERVVLVGVRELDEGEKIIIRQHQITCFTMHDIDRLGMARVMDEAIQIAARGSDGVHVSFDIDSIDPKDAPGTGTPVRGGLNYREAHLGAEMLYSAQIVTSADFVEVNPLLDNSHLTAKLAVELIASLLGERIL